MARCMAVRGGSWRFVGAFVALCVTMPCRRAEVLSACLLHGLSLLAFEVTDLAMTWHTPGAPPSLNPLDVTVHGRSLLAFEKFEGAGQTWGGGAAAHQEDAPLNHD